MEDPAAVVGTDGVQRAAFLNALRLISWRIDLMLALPIEKLERFALEQRVRNRARGRLSGCRVRKRFVRYALISDIHANLPALESVISGTRHGPMRRWH
jgi:hypothetical protein